MPIIQRYLWITILLCYFSIGYAETFEEGFEAYESKDYEAAYDGWEPLAEQGNPVAQYYLGILHANGWGIKKNIVAAVKWYRLAAEQDYAEAQYALANYLAEGVGVGKDAIEAFRWYLASAKAGFATSQFTLGDIYYAGLGVKQDYLKAVTWYQKAADQGHTFSLFNLANMNLYGIGVEKNIDEASKLYKEAANKGNLLATKRYASLEKRKICYAHATTRLFNVLIGCTARNELRNVLRNIHIPVISESNKRRYDVYRSAKLLKKSVKLSIGYTTEQIFAHAKYEFPSQSNRYATANTSETGQINLLLISIEAQYGPPDSVTGRAGKTAVEYSWQLDDNMILELKQDNPYTSAFLEYKHPENYEKLKQTLNTGTHKLRSKVFSF